jgi:PST family polysaccharide transporter
MAANGPRRKLFDAILWNAAGTVFQGGAQVFVGIVLARLLGPAPFGLMAMAFAAYGPAFILAEAGLGYALVQADNIGTEEISFSFWIQSCAGVVLALLLCLTAPRIAGFFDTPSLATVLLALSPAIVFQTVGLTAVNLLQRSVDFRRLQIIRLTAWLGSQVIIALPLAYFGAKVWSLVVATISNNVITSAVAYSIVRHDLGLSFSRNALRLVRLSRWYLLLNITNAVQGALMPIAMGRWLGVDAVGFFDRAYSLFVTPVDRAAAAVSGVLFPFFARTNKDLGQQRDVFLVCLTVGAFLGLPCGTVVAYHTNLIVGVILGPNWAATASLLLPLSFCIPISLFLEATVPVLNGRGRPQIEVMTVIGMIAIFVIAVSFAHHDAREFAWVLVGTYGFRVVCLLISIKYLLDIGVRSMLQAIVPGSIAAVVLLLGNLLVDQALPAGLLAALRLAIVVVVSAAMLLASWVFHRAWLGNRPLRRAIL